MKYESDKIMFFEKRRKSKDMRGRGTKKDIKKTKGDGQEKQKAAGSKKYIDTDRRRERE